eukprot:gene16662-7858_t
MEDAAAATPRAADVAAPAGGTHVVLPDHFSPDRAGVAALEAGDGRAMFYLPWQGRTLVGTTDSAADVTRRPNPPDKDVSLILSEVNRFLGPHTPATEADVLAAWVGIRAVPEAKVDGDHVVATIPGGGGPDNPLNLIGCRGTANEKAERIQTAHAAPYHHDAVQLLRDYHVAALAKADKSLRKRIAHQYPWIMAQVVYAVRKEHARSAADVDVLAAHNRATAKVVRCMGDERVRAPGSIMMFRFHHFQHCS